MSTRHNLLRLAAAALLSALPAPLHAAGPVETSASTIILRPLTVVKLADMDFGWIGVSAAGTITLDPANGTVSTTGGVFPMGGTPRAAWFAGASSGNAVVNIKLPKQAITLTRQSGTETLTLTNLTLDGPEKRTMARASSFEFKVGGRLNVAAGQADGTYLGTFTVTVQYP